MNKSNNQRMPVKQSLKVITALSLLMANSGEQQVNALQTEAKSDVGQLIQNTADTDQLEQAEKHHKKKHHKSRRGQKKMKKPRGYVSIGSPEDQDGAEKQAMSMVKEDLQNAIQDEEQEEQPTTSEQQQDFEEPQNDEEAHQRQQAMTERYDARPEDQFSTVSVNARDVTDERLDKQAQESRREYEEEERINKIARQKDEDSDNENDGQMAAQKIYQQQQREQARAQAEEQAEAEEQARFRAAMQSHQETGHTFFGAGNLAKQMLNSETPTPEVERPSLPQRVVEQPAHIQSIAQASLHPMSADVPTAHTASLIAQAIIHQKAKSAGLVDKEEEVQEEHPIYKPVTVKMMQPTATGPTNFSVTPSQEAQQQYMKSSSGKPIVSSEELEDAKTISPLSFVDKTAKDFAVQKTLEKLRGGFHQDAYPQPVPIAEKLAKPPVQVIEPLYKPTPVVMIPQHNSPSQPLLPPTPVVVQQAPAPMPDPYLKQAQSQKSKKDEEKDDEEDQGTTNDADVDNMNDVEERQRQAQARQKKNMEKEERGEEPTPQPQEQVKQEVQKVQAAAPQEAPKQVQVTVVIPPATPAAAPKADSSVQGQLDAIKKQSQESTAPIKISVEQILSKKQPTATPAPTQAPPSTQDAVKKTLEAIKKQQQATTTVAAPAPTVVAKPVEEKKQEKKDDSFGKMLNDLQSMTAHVNTTINTTSTQSTDNSPWKNDKQKSLNKVSQNSNKDEVLGFEIVTSKLDDDEPSPAPYSGMSHSEQPQANDLNKKKKHRQTNNKKDESTNFSIETSTMDSDMGSAKDAEKLAAEYNAKMRQKEKQELQDTLLGKRAAKAKAIAQAEKEQEETNFKIETTVANPGMLGKLVGENTPYVEEEEAPKQVIAKPEEPKMSASEIQFYLKQKALEEQKKNAVAAPKTVQAKQASNVVVNVVKQTEAPVAVAKPVVVSTPAPVQQQMTPAPKKITADHIIAATKNAKASIQNAPLKEAAPPTLTATSMKDKILQKTLTKSPADKMKAKILQKTQEKQVTVTAAPQQPVISQQEKMHNIIANIQNKQQQQAQVQAPSDIFEQAISGTFGGLLEQASPMPAIQPKPTYVQPKVVEIPVQKMVPEQVQAPITASVVAPKPQPVVLNVTALTHTVQNKTQNISMPQVVSNQTLESVKVHDQRQKSDKELKSMIQNIVSSIQPALQATGSNASVQVIISDGLSQHNVTQATVANLSSNTTSNKTSNITANKTIHISKSQMANQTANKTIATQVNSTANLTANVSANVSKTSNVSANVSKNVSANISKTQNVTKSSVVQKNTTANVTSNVTANVSKNISANTSKNVTKNASTVAIAQKNLTKNSTSNVTSNATKNVTASVNSTVNATKNISSNASKNITQNVSLASKNTTNMTGEITFYKTANAIRNLTTQTNKTAVKNVTQNKTVAVQANSTANVSQKVQDQITDALVNHKNTTITTSENVQKIIEAVTKSNAANMGGSNAHVNVTVIMQQPAATPKPVQQAVVAAPAKVPQHNVQITQAQVLQALELANQQARAEKEKKLAEEAALKREQALKTQAIFQQMEEDMKKQKAEEERIHKQAIERTLQLAIKKQAEEKKAKEEALAKQLAIQQQLMAKKAAEEAEAKKKHDAIIAKAIEEAKKRDEVKKQAFIQQQIILAKQQEKERQEELKREEAAKQERQKELQEMIQKRQAEEDHKKSAYQSAIANTIAAAKAQAASLHSFSDMASGLSATIDEADNANSTSKAASKESASGLIIPFKIPVKGAATQVKGIRDDEIVPVITTPTPPPAPSKYKEKAATNTQQAADLAAKLVKENPENALKILEQQEQQDKQQQAVAAPVMAAPASIIQAEPVTTESYTPVAADERQAIIQRTIALAKRQQAQSYHPLSGSLFDNLRLDLQTEEVNVAEFLKRANISINADNIQAIVQTNASKNASVQKNSSANTTSNASSNATAFKNMSANVSKNISANVSQNTTQVVQKNATQAINKTLNVTLNASKNVTMNLTKNTTYNASISVIQKNSSANSSKNMSANSTINMTKNATKNVSKNTTKVEAKNVSKNATVFVQANKTSNVSSNKTANKSVNASVNVSKNVSANKTQNMTMKSNKSVNATKLVEIKANVSSNVTANKTSNITANKTSNVTANKSSNTSVNKTANVTKNVTANVTMAVQKNVTKNVTTNITANVTANFTVNKTANITGNKTDNSTIVAQKLKKQMTSSKQKSSANLDQSSTLTESEEEIHMDQQSEKDKNNKKNQESIPSINQFVGTTKSNYNLVQEDLDREDTETLDKKQKEVEKKEEVKQQEPADEQNIGFFKKIGNKFAQAWHKLFLPQISSSTTNNQEKSDIFVQLYDGDDDLNIIDS